MRRFAFFFMVAAVAAAGCATMSVSSHWRLDLYDADSLYGYCYSEDCKTHVADYDQGTLVVDIVNPKTNKVVWRGWAQDTNVVIDNQTRLEKQVKEGVTKMMLQLPDGGSALR